MKIARLLAPMALLVVGCGGAAKTPTLSDGVYTVTSTTYATPSCPPVNIPFLATGDLIQVFVTDPTVKIAGVPYTLDGSTITKTTVNHDQASDTSGDSCTSTETFSADGKVTTDDAFKLHINDKTVVSNPSNWSGCNLQHCTSDWTFTASK